jgi:hypothetical protein
MYLNIQCDGWTQKFLGTKPGLSTNVTEKLLCDPSFPNQAGHWPMSIVTTITWCIVNVYIGKLNHDMSEERSILKALWMYILES